MHWNGQTWRFHPRDFTILTRARRPLRQVGDPCRHDDPGLGDHLRRARAVLRQVRVHGGHRRQGREPQGPDDRRRQRLRGPALARVPGRAAAGHRAERAVPEGGERSSATTRSPARPRTCRCAYKNPDGITRGQCTYCGFCERFGCEVGAKADPTVTVIPVALKTGRFKIIDYANAFAIKNDGKNGAERPLLRRDGAASRSSPPTSSCSPRTCSTTCGTLLLSKLGTPYDPATGDWRRRHELRLPDRRRRGERLVRRTRVQALHGLRGDCRSAIDDFNADNFDHTGLGFIGGGSITSGQSGARPIQSLTRPAGHAVVRQGVEGGDPEVLPSVDQRRLPGRVAGLPAALPRPRPELPRQVRQPARSGSRSTGSRTSGR